MITHKRLKIISLIGILVIMWVLWAVPQLFNAPRNFRRLQELAGHNPRLHELVWDSSAFKRNAVCEIYVLATEWDLRFYPIQYVVVTKYKDERVVVDLISGPGPGGVVTLKDHDAVIYLESMQLNLLR